MQHSLENKKEYAKAFRRTFFTSLARGEVKSNHLDFIKMHFPVDNRVSLRDFFCSAFDELRKSYRNEYIYKSFITNKIVLGRYSPLTSSISFELAVNKSIVDIAVFNKESTAYEIKTEFDTPRRLLTQTPDYVKAFDKVYVVTHPKFSKRYCDMVLPNVGVMVLTEKDTLQTVKEAISNSDQRDLRFIFNMMRKGEYVAIIESYLNKKLDVPNGLISGYCREVFFNMPKEIAYKLFLKAMQARTTTQENADFIYSLPASLRVLGYSTPLSKKQREYIMDIIDDKGFLNVV